MHNPFAIAVGTWCEASAQRSLNGDTRLTPCRFRDTLSWSPRIVLLPLGFWCVYCFRVEIPLILYFIFHPMSLLNALTTFSRLITLLTKRE